MILIIRPKKDSKKILNFNNTKEIEFYFENFSKYKNIKINFIFEKKENYLISSKQTIISLKKNNYLTNHFLKNAKIYVIGNEVFKELKLCGAKKILKIFNDSFELEEELKNSTIKSLTHLSGPIQNDVIVNFVKKGKVNYKFEKTYEISYKKNISSNLSQLINQKKIKYMLHYSLHASEVFFSRLNDKEKKYFQSKIMHLCMSRRISSGLRRLYVNKHLLQFSKKPNHESLMLLLNNDF